MAVPNAKSDQSEPARTTRHAGLDRDDVVEAALRLVENGGTKALTMRKLAAELGVAPTTIYWHVGGRDEVVEAVVARQGEQLASVEVTGDDPVERVTSAARHVWSSALAHPEVMKLAHAHGATSLLEMHLEAALARELEAAGLRGEAARDALRGILLCVGGFLVVALRAREQVPEPLASTRLWADLDDQSISVETRTALSEPVDIEELFETTLGHVVTGFLR